MHDVDAVVYGMSGPEDVVAQTKRRGYFDCRRTYGPNFYVQEGKKVNAMRKDDVEDVLFVRSKVRLHSGLPQVPLRIGVPRLRQQPRRPRRL